MWTDHKPNAFILFDISLLCYYNCLLLLKHGAGTIYICFVFIVIFIGLLFLLMWSCAWFKKYRRKTVLGGDHVLILSFVLNAGLLTLHQTTMFMAIFFHVKQTVLLRGCKINAREKKGRTSTSNNFPKFLHGCDKKFYAACYQHEAIAESKACSIVQCHLQNSFPKFMHRCDKSFNYAV